MDDVTAAQRRPAPETDRHEVDVAQLGPLTERRDVGGHPLVAHAGVKGTVVSAMPFEQVNAADLRSAPEPSEDLADVTIPVGGSEEVGRGVGDGGEHRVAPPDRRLEPLDLRVRRQARPDRPELGRRRQRVALIRHDALLGPPTPDTGPPELPPGHRAG